MKVISGKETHPKLTVGQFLEAFPNLRMEVLAGREGLSKLISSPRIQKPGLALAGVPEFVHAERIQILGSTEISFLERQTPEFRRAALRHIYDQEVSCFLITKNLTPPPEVLALSEETVTPVLRTPEASSVAIQTVTEGLAEALAPCLTVHGVLVDVFGVGLLIIGKGSIGKSESALDLVLRGHRLVSDDMVVIRRRSETLTGSAPPFLKHIMELRGLGVVDIKELFGVVATRDRKDVELVVELEHWADGKEYDRLGIEEEFVSILGVKVPYILMPVAPGRVISILLEVAVRNLLLKRKGIHTARTFDQRLKEELLRKGEDLGEP
ncbi:MAG: HPr(Ser) kinase/phosphatase [Acidobacteriota bacterium]